MKIVKGKRIVDELGHVYELDQKLGEGGQGAVFSVKGGKKAIKILNVNKCSEAERIRLSQQIRQVKLLYLPDLKGLPIAAPLEMLKSPNLGYVMELLTDMIPISTLMNVPKKVSDKFEWYLEGGGLRRRLLLLAKCAEALAQLHGKGLIYADPSSNNIFISIDRDESEIRLIDADNLHYHSNESSINCCTKPFGSPELVVGKSGANTLTDAYAFAVIAFQTLSVVHPLIGDMVNEGEPELEEQAFRGEHPWIDHPDDPRNATERGLPREIVLSPRLRDLCQRNFGIGLKEPKKRPGVGEWAENLYSAADFTIQCPNCRSTYYPTSKNCPWCDHARPSFVLIKINYQCEYELDRDFKQHKPLHIIALEKEQKLPLTERITMGRTGFNSHSPNLEVDFDGQNISVSSLNGKCYWLTWETQDKTNMVKEVKENPVRFSPLNNNNKTAYLLHFGEPNSSLHRFAYFQFIKGAD